MFVLGNFKDHVNYDIIGLSFHDVDKRVKWRWEHEGVILDEDGSLTGSKNYQLLPNSGIVNSTVCQVYECFKLMNHCHIKIYKSISAVEVITWLS